MAEDIYLEVEENDNCDGVPMMVYEALEDPVPVSRVRVSEPGRLEGVHEVTGWSSEDGGTPCPAMYAPVSNSGRGGAHLVCGGDWGLRLKPLGSTEGWDLDSPSQWGAPYLLLLDAADVILEA